MPTPKTAGAAIKRDTPRVVQGTQKGWAGLRSLVDDQLIRRPAK